MSKVTTTLLISFFCFIVTVYGAPLLSSEQGIERTADTPANYGNSYDSGNGYTLTYMLQPHIPFIPIGSPSVASSISYAANQYAQALSNANAISFLGGNATAHTNATVQGQLAFSNATATASGLGLVETDAATSSGSSYSGNIEIAFTVGGTVTAHSDSFSAPGFGTVTISGFGGAGPFGMALFGSYPSSGSSRFLLHNARKAGDIF
ncbi:uncharacterized protein Gasu_51970 [Galdieria sulphuraria]|uniref:Dirigent protein n=1 Tax=Galdieria sulphuraria TaxID=130081 RepID=M2VVG5_GALSU|nr:uncharacterized protein Gasu_51970 [Galdieria sulphuraria]EME27216.1 hypothetical protein Gasu_51970 [Galdieria sulphuraria]|eukprot:XP_005703736.1 hypothetical protein Gasu_51970 [Galdieria sulphuraria]